MDILGREKLKERIRELEDELRKIKSIKKEKYIELTPDLAMCELDDVDEIPIFVDSVKAIRNKMLYCASRMWPEWKEGGYIPRFDEYATTTILPRLFTREFKESPLRQYKQRFSETGWVNIFECTTPEGVILGMGGIGFVPSTNFSRVTELGFTIGDVRYPKINVEEGFNKYKNPALLLNNPIILEEEESFQLRVHLEDNLSKGEREISVFPIRGVAFYRRKSDIYVD